MSMGKQSSVNISHFCMARAYWAKSTDTWIKGRLNNSKDRDLQRDTKFNISLESHVFYWEWWSSLLSPERIYLHCKGKYLFLSLEGKRGKWTSFQFHKFGIPLLWNKPNGHMQVTSLSSHHCGELVHRWLERKCSVRKELKFHFFCQINEWIKNIKTTVEGYPFYLSDKVFNFYFRWEVNVYFNVTMVVGVEILIRRIGMYFECNMDEKMTRLIY